MKLINTLIVNDQSYKIECDDALYYDSLAAAVEDLNTDSREQALPDTQTASVRVSPGANGRKRLQLLGDVTVDTGITISSDVELCLQGHTLTLTTVAAQLTFAAGTDCVLDATAPNSSMIKNVTGTGTETAYMIYTGAKTLRILGGLYSMNTNGCKARLIRSDTDSGSVELEGCTLSATSAVSDPGLNLRGLQNDSRSFTVKDCTLNLQGVAVCGLLNFTNMTVENSRVQIMNTAGYTVGINLNDENAALQLLRSRVEVITIGTADSGYGINIPMDGSTVTVEDSVITVKNQNTAQRDAVVNAGITGIYNNATLRLVRSQVLTGNTSRENMYSPGSYANVHAISNQGTMEAEGSLLFADAADASVGTTTADGEVRFAGQVAVGLIGNRAGSVRLLDTEVIGTHSGIQNYGELYVTGGSLSSWSHGGLYTVHTRQRQVCLKDCLVRSGYYDQQRGAFAELYVPGGHPHVGQLAAFYFGNSEPNGEGGALYMDGCSLEGIGGEAFVVRPANTGDSNLLYMSNTDCTVCRTDGTLSPVRLNKYAGQILTEARAGIRIGVNCSLQPLAERFTEPEALAYVRQTGELYRQHHPQAPMTGRDYTRYAQAQSNVRFAEQTLTPEQQAQARENMGLTRCPRYMAVNPFAVGDNALTADKVGTAANWTVSGSTFTHTAGSAEALHIALGDLAVAGDEWLVTFACEELTDNYLSLSFGSEALTQTYNGTSSVAVALRVKEDGDDLLLTPAKTFNGTLTNFQIRKITADGTKQYEFTTDSIANMDRQIPKTGFWNVVLGTEHTMTNSPNSSRTVAIGHNALRQLRTGNRNIAIGTYAMSQLEGGEQNISIGADSMFEVKSGHRNIVLGKGAASRGTNLGGNVVIGDEAMAGGPESNANFNIVIGRQAAVNLGKSASSTSDNTARNIIMGYLTAQNMTTGIANVYIGDQITAANGKNQNVVIGASAKATGEANRSIAIGYQAETTKANQCVIGGTNITEFVLGNKVLRFREDGTVGWTDNV